MNWVVFGLAVFAGSFVVGAGFLGPESGRLGRLIEDHGAGAPAVAARIRRILAVSRVELVFLAAVVWAMVVKPVGNAGWFFGGLAVTAIVAAGVVSSYLRGEKGMQSAAAPAAD